MVSLSIGATGSPSVKVTVPVWTRPWGPVDSAGVAVGVTGVTVGGPLHSLNFYHKNPDF